MTKTTRFILALAAAAVTLSGGVAAGQAPPPDPHDDIYELILVDGSRLFGRVLTDTADHVTFRSAAGTVTTVARAQIASLERVRGRIVDGRFIRDDPNQTRLFFAPTGRAVPKGEATFGVYLISMPFLQFGVTDRFSIGGGTPLIAGLGEGDRPFWITPKFQVLKGETYKASIGSLVMIAGGEGFHITYAVLTREGGGEGSMSTGVGIAGNSSGGGFGVAMLGGEGAVSRNVRVVTENYISRHGAILSGGLRFTGDKLSADVGLVWPAALDVGFVVPVVNFVFAIGR